MAQPKTSKKLIIDYNKLRSLFRFNCPEHLIIKALKLEPVEKTGDELIDDILESLVDYREFDNWGGGRLGAGRKPKNQLENQDEKINLKIKMVKSSCVNQDVDKDKDIDNNNILNNISKFINEYTLFKAGFQGWVFPLEIRKVAMQHWSADEVRNIEKDFSCHEYETETSINDLLQIYPPKPKTTRFVKPTLEEVKAYCRERMNMVDAEKFMNYYESNGWKVGKNPMKDWKAAIRTWEKSTTTQQQQTVLRLSPRERQDMINKQKTEALLKTLEEKGF